MALVSHSPSRTCATCAHARTELPGMTCARDQWVDSLTGETSESEWYCICERAAATDDRRLSSGDPCGPDGKHWTPKSAAKDDRPWWQVTNEPRSWWRRLLGLPPKLRDYPLRHVRDHVFANFTESRGSYIPSPNQLPPPR